MGFQAVIISLCTLGVIALVPPLVWHASTRNIPAIILIVWLLLVDIKYIVNAAIWSGADFMEKWDGKGWCDIMVKIQIGANVGICCAVTNIIFNLHIVLKADNILLEVGTWKKIMRDLSISLITPIIVMGFSHIFQISRYSITPYYGCVAYFAPTRATTAVYTMWLLIWSLIGAIYAVLVLCLYHKKRKDVKDILYCTNSGLNIARFARLLIFSFLIILVIFPFSIFLFVKDLKSVKGPVNVKDIHAPEFWFTIIKLRVGKTSVDIWLYVLMSFIVFLIFGLGSDALRMYANFLRLIHLGVLVDKPSDIPRTKFDQFLDDLVRDQETNKFGVMDTAQWVVDSPQGPGLSYDYHFINPYQRDNFPLEENEVDIEKTYVFKPTYRMQTFMEEEKDVQNSITNDLDDDLTFSSYFETKTQYKFPNIYQISTKSTTDSITKDDDEDDCVNDSPVTKVDSQQ